MAVFPHVTFPYKLLLYMPCIGSEGEYLMFSLTQFYSSMKKIGYQPKVKTLFCELDFLLNGGFKHFIFNKTSSSSASNRKDLFNIK